MAKDPAFLFYPADYIGGTMGMTFEEKGAYIELLMLQFNRGHMTKDMILHTLGHNAGHLFGRIEVKFLVDSNGLYYNDRLDIEKKKRENFTNSRRNNKLGANQHSKKEEENLGHMTYHMVNVNYNITNTILRESFVKFLLNQKVKKNDVQIELLLKKLNSFPNDSYRLKSIENAIRAGHSDFYELQGNDTAVSKIRQGTAYNEEKTMVLLNDGSWDDLTENEMRIIQADEYHLPKHIIRK